MHFNKPLSEAQIEEANAFRIGERVKINEFSQKPWIGDWIRTEGSIHGVAIDQSGKANYTLLHDGDQLTDGFEASDLVAI